MPINYGANSKTDVDVQAAFRQAAKRALSAAGRGRKLDMEGFVFDQ